MKLWNKGGNKKAFSYWEVMFMPSIANSGYCMNVTSEFFFLFFKATLALDQVAN